MDKKLVAGILILVLICFSAYSIYQTYIVVPYGDKEHIPHDTVVSWIMWSVVGIFVLLIFFTVLTLFLLFVFSKDDGDRDVLAQKNEKKWLVDQKKKEKELKKEKKRTRRKTTEKKPPPKKEKKKETSQKKKTGVQTPEQWKERRYE